MTIRSVDMQVLVQKVSDVSKIQHTQQSQSGNKQQENAAQIMQQTDTISKSVNQNRETESKRVHDEKEKEKRKKQSKKNKKEDKDELGNSGIDIIV